MTFLQMESFYCSTTAPRRGEAGRKPSSTLTVTLETPKFLTAEPKAHFNFHN